MDDDGFELVIIGGGNMGAALLGGLIDSGAFAESALCVVEVDSARRAHLAAQLPSIAIEAAVPRCCTAVLAVKPDGTAAAASAAADAGAPARALDRCRCPLGDHRSGCRS